MSVWFYSIEEEVGLMYGRSAGNALPSGGASSGDGFSQDEIVRRIASYQRAEKTYTLVEAYVGALSLQLGELQEAMREIRSRLRQVPPDVYQGTSRMRMFFSGSAAREAAQLRLNLKEAELQEAQLRRIVQSQIRERRRCRECLEQLKGGIPASLLPPPYYTPSGL